MAVYEHAYRQYQGELTPLWSRFLIIPRHAYQDVFKSKLFTAFFALCYIGPLVAAIMIYLHHNTSALAIFQLAVRELVPIDADFFRTFVVIQGMLGFFLNLFIGPPLVSRDTANNALPLYLARPFSRTEYVVGKMSVLVILLSAITWVPLLLLFLFQAYLVSANWFVSNLWIGGAIFLGSLIWITVLALLSQAASAWLKWRMAASAALLALFFIPEAIGGAINNVFRTNWGNLINLRALIGTVWAGLFRTSSLLELPLWSAWLMLLTTCAVCLVIIARKVRAYEVVG